MDKTALMILRCEFLKDCLMEKRFYTALAVLHLMESEIKEQYNIKEDSNHGMEKQNGKR